MSKNWIALVIGSLIMLPMGAYASFMVSYSDSYYDDHYNDLRPNYVRYSNEPVYYSSDNGYYYYYARPAYRSRHHYHQRQQDISVYNSATFAARMPSQITAPGEKEIIVNPNVHAWGAYGPDGKLIRGGVATAGGDYCPDIGRRCHTKSGEFRINSLGSFGCKSTLYPLPNGGAPMPYCMYFNGSQALHGSYEVVDGNASHGCVRLKVEDAQWIRFDFANIGTRVIVQPY